MNATQFIGLLVFACAAIACARTALARRDRIWWTLAAASAACVFEVAVGLRHRVHDAVDAVLQALGWYASRGPVQVVLLLIALLLAAGTIAWLLALRRAGPDARVAAAAAALALWLFLVEAISLHDVDAVMYLPIGPVLLIGWVWAGIAAVMVGAALRAASVRRESVPARRR